MVSIPLATMDNLPTEIVDFYTVNRNTFSTVNVGAAANKFEVEIGDAEQDDFIPQMKLKRWSNECNFSVRLIDIELDIPVIKTRGNKIKYIKEKREAHFYNVSKTDEMPECYEFEIILKEQPATNVIQMSIETKGLNFCYQPELTQEEIDEGAFRPENVIGSYAVYHESKQGDYSKQGLQNYMAGKAFHIYRPKMIDSAGKEVWGTLNIADDLLTVEIPQEFLDNAVYPVKHAAGLTFGYTTLGASEFTTANNNLKGRIGTATIGTVTNIVFGARDSFDYFKPVLVLASNKTIVTNGVGEPTHLPVIKDWAYGSFSTPPSLSETDYFACIVGNSTIYMAYDAGGVSGDSIADASNSYASPIDPTDANNSSWIYSIYCTYSAPSTVKPMWYYNLLRERNQ